MMKRDLGDDSDCSPFGGSRVGRLEPSRAIWCAYVGEAGILMTSLCYKSRHPATDHDSLICYISQLS